MKSGKVSPVLYVVLGVSLGLFGFFLLLANPFGWKLPIPTLTKVTNNTDQTIPDGADAAPTPYLFLPHGKQTYTTEGGSGRSKITSITYDPLDPEKNSNQKVSALVLSTEPVQSVNLTVNTDNQTNTYSMKLESGTSKSGTWSATFQSIDTYEAIYNVSFEIITELGNKTTQPMLLR